MTRSCHHRFVAAFRNVDGVPGYDPFNDVLFSELVDTNGTLDIDAGDTVRIYAHPTDFVGGVTTTIGAPNHTVDFVNSVDASQMSVRAGSNTFFWLDGASSDDYGERTDLSQNEVTYRDRFVNWPNSFEFIILNPGAPSAPDVTVEAVKNKDDDETWLDVEVTLP